MTSFLPEYCVLPRDPIDPRFVLSFNVQSEHYLEDAIQFFEEYGFVVFRNIFTDEQCSETREAMWRIIEDANPGFIRYYFPSS